jgi:hypothetical protein
MTVVMPELYIKKIIIEYYPAVVIIKPRVFIKAKLITFIDTSYAPTESREDIKTKNAQNERRLKELGYSQPYVSVTLAESMGKNT